MGDQWPWLMITTALWTSSVSLLTWATFGGPLTAAAWGVWCALAAGVTTAWLIAVWVAEQQVVEVEHIATIAAQEALRCREVSSMRSR